MRYETAIDNGLTVIIQPSHNLSRLFRKYQDVAANYNLRGQGQEPLHGLVSKLFPDDEGEYHAFLQTVLEGYKKNPPGSQHNLNVYRTRVETYGIGMLIGEYITVKLYIAALNLFNKGNELLKPGTPLFGESFERSRRIAARIKKTTDSLTEKQALAVNGVSIVFEGAEGENTYVFRKSDFLEFMV